MQALDRGISNTIAREPRIKYQDIFIWITYRWTLRFVVARLAEHACGKSNGYGSGEKAAPRHLRIGKGTIYVRVTLLRFGLHNPPTTILVVCVLEDRVSRMLHASPMRIGRYLYPRSFGVTQIIMRPLSSRSTKSVRPMRARNKHCFFVKVSVPSEARDYGRCSCASE